MQAKLPAMCMAKGQVAANTRELRLAIPVCLKTRVLVCLYGE